MKKELGATLIRSGCSGKSVDDLTTLPDWLDSLGYSAEGESLHQSVDAIPRHHPYARELSALLAPDGAIKAQAVYAADGTPTVVFVGASGASFSKNAIDELRKKIWNQNLASVVVEIRGDTAIAFPTNKVKRGDSISLSLKDATPNGTLSARDVKSADLATRRPDWFTRAGRVDHKLVLNISMVVKQLTKDGFTSRRSEAERRTGAQLLIGQVLFVSYLEHREIVSQLYRGRRGVLPMHELVKKTDRTGLAKLIDCLQDDFNGDFLSGDRHEYWKELNDDGFNVIDEFLMQTEMKTGQGSFWNYDFSFIPVELLSNLYESFLNKDQKKAEGAVYTPRNVAVLAVDQALSAVSNPCLATIFDGACGSGILLTTALRRLILAHEERLGRPTTLGERRDILTSQIFGGDINKMAGRVTAFSLYLSVLEDLDPKDILAAQEQHESRLPSLAGINLVCHLGGNFFNLQHPFEGRTFDIVISNPPWVQSEGKAVTEADKWAKARNQTVVQRQLSAAFALRSHEFLPPGGVLCLILPIQLLLGATSRDFVSQFFRKTRPIHLINFGDLQQLLFQTSMNTCHLFLGVSRDAATKIPMSESFDYSVPKADLSIAMGRLSLQSSDRHRLLTTEVIADNEILTQFMWGDANDVALISRLCSYGRISDMLRSASKYQPIKWISRKGVHLVDESKEQQSAEPLFAYPFYTTAQLNKKLPISMFDAPSKWPSHQDKVVGLDASVMRLFDGPRVLFADGFDKSDLTPRAVFVKGKGAFTSSVGVIAGPEEDEDLFRFLAVYLRSTLARYLMMMTNAKMLTERNGIHLADLKQFPFFRPSLAPKADIAGLSLRAVAELTRELEGQPDAKRVERYQAMYEQLNDWVFDYFGLDVRERSTVRETVKVLMPAIRPRSFKRLTQLARDRINKSDVEHYSKHLLSALANWRKASGGKGAFHVATITTQLTGHGALGVAQVEYDDNLNASDDSDARVDADFVNEILGKFHTSGLFGTRDSEGVTFMPTVEIWFQNKFYVARPLQRRNWTSRMALRDADRLVQAVRYTAPAPSSESASFKHK